MFANDLSLRVLWDYLLHINIKYLLKLAVYALSCFPTVISELAIFLFQSKSEMHIMFFF